MASLALFFSADIYQGDERFSVHSRGKQCAFMSLSALLTVRNIPLNLWSRITFKYALLQGDKMFLNALDSAGPFLRIFQWRGQQRKGTSGSKVKVEKCLYF